MSDLRLDIATSDPETFATASLESGERLIWATRTQHRRPGLGWLKLVLVGLAVAGLGVFWIWSYSRGEDVQLGSYAGWAFVLVGALLATGPLWLGMTGGPAVYALTDRRLFMVTGRHARLVRSALIERIGTLTVNAGPDGSGDILFSAGAGSASGESGLQVNGLYGIADAARVAALVEDQQARHSGSQTAAKPGVGDTAA